MRANLLLIIVVGSLLLLGACDGGSGSNHQNNPPDDVIPPDDPDSGLTGVLFDSPVSGVAYETRSHKGVTGPNGSFHYEEGETVRFRIGNILLGEVKGQEQVTPFDLAGSKVLTGIHINWALADLEDPFQAVVNITVLLQSLDDDANPENGIAITPEVAALFQSLSPELESPRSLPIFADNFNLDVSQDWRTFLNEARLHHALGTANSQQLFSVAHTFARPAAALQHLYKALDIDPRTVGISLLQYEDGVGDERFQYDANGYMTRHDNSRILGGANAFETWQYDASSNVTRHETHLPESLPIDFPVNVQPNFPVETWQYDATGNLIRAETIRNPDGVPDNIVSYEYDADGNRTRRADDEDGDGNPDYIWSWQYAYDANGNLTQFVEATDFPDNSDGTSSLSWSYDANGNVTRREGFSELPGGITLRNIVTSQYDNMGNVTREENDFDGDGNPDNIASWLYEYGTDGHLARKQRTDTTDEGVLREEETWLYDANGSLTGVEWKEYGDHPGQPQNTESTQYRLNGNMKQKIAQHFVFQDDELGKVSQEEYQYDVDGKQTRYEEQSFADCLSGYRDSCYEYKFLQDGKTGELNSWQYDNDGHLTRAEYAYDGGAAWRMWTWQYDTSGNLTRAECDCADGETDGIPDRIYSWEYGTDGNLTRSGLDENGDGTPEETKTYEHGSTEWGHLFSDVMAAYSAYPRLRPTANPDE